MQAIAGGEIELIERALKEFESDFASYRQADGATLLHLSVVCGPAMLTKELLSRGIDVNAQTKTDKATALHMAVSSGRLTTVEVLLECEGGIDDTIRDSAGRTPLDLAHDKPIETAIRWARNKFVEKVVKQMHRLVQKGEAEKIRELMGERRAAELVDVNTPDRSGETILHKAAKSAKVELVKACLAVGANPFAKNRRGKLPIEMTTSEQVRNLLKHGTSHISESIAKNFVAPMVEASPDLLLLEEGGYPAKLSGYLLKYTNFASGFRRRFVVLEDGLLSYYKSKEDYPVSCKGSLNVRFAQLSYPLGDLLRFELRTDKYSLFFKAENEVEATKWKLALSQWQKSTREDDLPEKAGAIMASRFQLLNFIAEREEYQQMLNYAEDCLHQLEVHLNILTNQYYKDRVDQSLDVPDDPVVQPLLHSLAKFFTVCRQSERSWRERLEVELKQRAMMEDLVNEMGNKKLKKKTLPNSSTSMDGMDPLIGDTAEFNDEFFDAEDDASVTVAELQSSSELLISSATESMLIPPPTESPLEQLAELKIMEQSIPEEDMEFVRDVLIGYSDIRRDKIPVDSTQIPPLSLWNIIKNAWGKDLTRIPIPVNFSEPISMLQRLAEDLEYADLLYLASVAEDPLMRLQYAAAFAVSPYASTDGRISKPFNPLLGETFEYVSRDHGFRYISEQVSHHPPISACYCESAKYAYYAEVSVRTKFWGKSLELVPEGLNHIKLKTTGEHFSYRKVNSAVHNLIMGKMWIDHYGPLRIVNHGTGEAVEIEFKQTGWRCSDPKKLEGFAYDREGNARYALEGFWNRYLRTRNLKTGELVELWRRRPLPPWSETMYNFTYFAMTQNELNPRLAELIAPTDSRLRPDQRAMEDGRFSEANLIKVKLEEKQRDVRKAMEISGEVHIPRWFEQATDVDTGESYWKYLGGYWESRKKGNWGNWRNIYLSPESSPYSTESSSTKNSTNYGLGSGPDLISGSSSMLSSKKNSPPIDNDNDTNSRLSFDS